MILQKASSSCEYKNFPSCSSAVHEILIQLRVSGFYLLGRQLKRRIAIQALNGAIDFFLSWRLNVTTNHEDWFAQSNSESNPNFVKNVACIQN